MYTSTFHADTGYSMEQSEILVSLMASSLLNSLTPMWASMITHKDKVFFIDCVFLTINLQLIMHHISRRNGKIKINLLVHV